MSTPTIPVGIDDFKKLRTNNLYYVDKTHMIREFWDDGSDVLLIPRPRRFGKSLNISMLRTFFEQSSEDQHHLFEGLSVTQQADLMAEQGQYPVLYLNFKNIKFDNWNDARAEFQFSLWKTCQHLSAQYPSDLWEPFRTMDQPDYPFNRVQRSMLDVCEVLQQITGKQVIVLIDEYDSPLLEAWLQGYYEPMVTFLRGLLGSLLKTNPYLKKALLTGILRLAKESIFSDLNNLEVYSFLKPQFSSCFGFTEEEVSKLLDDCSMDSTNQQQLSDWYNGYLFGGRVIYNPWSVLAYVKNRPLYPEPYWANTSANELVRQLILEESNEDIQKDVETILNGQPLKNFLVNDQIPLRDVWASGSTIWNLLTFSGYLKPINPQWDENEDLVKYDLVPPNKEVRIYFRRAIGSWLDRELGESSLHSLFESLRNQDWETFQIRFQKIVIRSISYHDAAEPEPEKFYHALMLGMLLNLHDYQVKSNRESGYGRYDVMVQPKDIQRPGFIFEFKKLHSEKKESPEEAMQSALNQIQSKQYAAELKANGVQEIIGIGVVVHRKDVWMETVSL